MSAARTVAQLLDQRRLADTGLAGEHDRASLLRRAPEHRHQPVELGITTPQPL
jgi:hypothetical protein